MLERLKFVKGMSFIRLPKFGGGYAYGVGLTYSQVKIAFMMLVFGRMP